MRRLLILLGLTGILTVILPVAAGQSVKVTWDAPSGRQVSGYIIFRRAEWEKEFEWLAAVKGSSYVDVAVRPGETYYYVVRSYDSRTNQESKDSPVMKVQVPKEGR